MLHFRLSRSRFAAALFALSLFPAAHAAEPGLYAEEENTWLDDSRQAVRDASVWLASGINSWFGDKPFEDGGSVTNGRLKVSTLWRRDDGVDVNVRFRARFDLPNLSDNAYFFFGRENKEEMLQDTPEAFSREQQLIHEEARDDAFFAGVGTESRSGLGFRIGVRSSDWLYAQARYKHDWHMSLDDRLLFRETVFASIKRGLGSTTTVDYEHDLTHTLMFRWLNRATITTKDHGWNWNTSLGLYQQFSHSRLLSLELLASGNTKNHVDVSEYGARLKWYQPIYRDWLFAEFVLGHFWPRDEDAPRRERTWAAGLGLEILF